MMKLTLPGLAMLAALGAGPALAQAQIALAAKAPAKDPAKTAAMAKIQPKKTGGRIAFSEYDLPNGLHVILHEDHSSPVVAVTVMYHVGSKNEQADRTGFAHFFEHLLFEGSDNLKRGEYMRTIKSAGGNLNANTTSDRTFYYEVLPSNQLELALYMESERMMHAKIDVGGVETQREVVKEEKRQRYDNRPYGQIFPSILEKSYTVHPYKWSTIGSMDHLNAAKLEEFIAFYKQFYVPNNAILSIAGDITPAQAKTLVAKYFGEIKKGTGTIYRPNVKEPEKTKEVRDSIYDNINLPAVVEAYHIPEQGTPDYYALNLLTNYLSNGESSVLEKEIVDKQQKAVNIGAFPISLEDPGLFAIFAIAGQGVNKNELQASIDEQIEKVKKDKISERDFTKVQNQMETEFITQNASAAGIAENLAQYKMYFGDANLINTEIERYRKVTREDLQRVAQKYLRNENRLVLYCLPKKNS